MEQNQNNQNQMNRPIGEEPVELDLAQYGNMDISSGGLKPTFEKITKVKVKSAILMTTKERKTEKDKSGKDQTFYPVYLKTYYQYGDLEIYENFSGGKLFVSETTKQKKFWVGANSALGKLKTLIENNFEFDGTLGTIPLIILGKEVGIKTVKNTVAGKEYSKNLIEVFYQ